MKITLREKILIPVLSVIALGMTAGFVYSYLASTRAIEESVKRSLVREVRLTAGLMDKWLEERITDLSTWSAQSVLTEALTEAGYYGRSARKGANDLLENLENGYPYYDFLFVVDKNGDLISTSHGSVPKQYSVRDRDYFKASIKGKTWISDMIISRESNQKVFVVSVPLKVGDEIVGILAGAVKVSEFASFFIHDFKLGQKGFAYVVEKNGNVMEISIPINSFSSIAPFDFGRKILSTGKGTLRYHQGDQTLFSAYELLGNKDWTFVVSQSLDEAFASARKTGWYTLIAGLVLLLLVGGVVANIFRRMIYQRFDGMLAAIGMVEKGDLAVRIKGGDEDDEIGELSKAFNTMTARLEKNLVNLQKEIQVRKNTEQSLANHRDTLEKRVRERTSELLNLQSYLSDIIDSMPSIIVGVDKEMIVGQWNLKAEQTTGIFSFQALGTSFDTLFPHLQDRGEKIRHAIADKQILRNTKVPRSGTDPLQYDDITVYPLMSEGMEGAVIRIDEVTERVKLEEMMIQSEKMMSVGGLAAGMAHEINNPLAGILQNAQVLKNRMSKALPKNIEVAQKLGIDPGMINQYMEDRGMYLLMENMMQAGKRAAEIVENMLSFSGKGQHDFSQINVPDIMDKSIDLAQNDYSLEKKFDFKQIQIFRQYRDLDLFISCHPSMLQQVFFNILQNGAQAMASLPDKTVAIAFTISIEKKGEMAWIEIKDNGPGMDKETCKRIFEPFFTTKEIGVGTGLGLSVSYFIIVENHGGSIEVNSVPGQGSTFIICLPIKGKDRSLN
jgi:signal transduction histidine kinase/HAMP domain-containing protein